jgi:hypothetical protein
VLYDLIVVLSPLEVTTPLRTQTQLDTVHGHPLYRGCPDVLSLVGELLSGYGWGSSDTHVSFAVFMYLFVFEMQLLSFIS